MIKFGYDAGRGGNAIYHTCWMEGCRRLPVLVAGNGEGLRCIKAEIAFRARETSNQLWAIGFVAEI